MPCSPPPWRRRRPIPLLLGYAVAWLACAGPVHAHPVDFNQVEHSVQLSVGARYIDVTVRLQVNEVLSLSERRRMDRNRDGRIDAAERDGYLRRIRKQLGESFKLACDGVELPLIELYDPRLDLLGFDSVSPQHHVVELFFFAHTPTHLAAGSHLVFEDRAYAAAPALRRFTPQGSDGVQVRAEAVVSTQPEGSRPECLRGVCRVLLRVAPAAETKTQMPAKR